jgi:hypothetical protein
MPFVENSFPYFIVLIGCCQTEWLSGSGGTGGPRLNACAFAGQAAPAKKRLVVE